MSQKLRDRLITIGLAAISTLLVWAVTAGGYKEKVDNHEAAIYEPRVGLDVRMREQEAEQKVDNNLRVRIEAQLTRIETKVDQLQVDKADKPKGR